MCLVCTALSFHRKCTCVLLSVVALICNCILCTHKVCDVWIRSSFLNILSSSKTNTNTHTISPFSFRKKRVKTKKNHQQQQNGEKRDCAKQATNLNISSRNLMAIFFLRFLNFGGEFVCLLNNCSRRIRLADVESPHFRFVLFF